MQEMQRCTVEYIMVNTLKHCAATLTWSWKQEHQQTLTRRQEKGPEREGEEENERLCVEASAATVQLTSAFYIMYSVHCETASCLLRAILHLYLSLSLSLGLLHSNSWLHSFVSKDSLLKRSFSAQHEEDFHLRTLAVMTVSALRIPGVFLHSTRQSYFGTTFRKMMNRSFLNFWEAFVCFIQ